MRRARSTICSAGRRRARSTRSMRRVRAALRLGAYQLARSGVPPHAAVGETVELVERARPRLRQRRTARAGALGTAVAAARTATTSTAIGVRTSHPDWIVQSFVDEFGRRPTRIATLELDNEPPPVTLRVNPMRTDVRGSSPTELRGAGVDVGPARSCPTRCSCVTPATSARCRRVRDGRVDAPGPGESGRRRRCSTRSPATRARRRVGAGRQGDGAPPSAWRDDGLVVAADLHRDGCALSCGPPTGRRSRPIGRPWSPTVGGPRSRRERSTGCCSTRRAPGSACSAGGPTRAGACSRSDVDELAALQRVLLPAAAARGPAGRPARVLGVHAHAAGDGRGRRVGASELARASSRSRRRARRGGRTGAGAILLPVGRAHRRHVRPRALNASR